MIRSHVASVSRSSDAYVRAPGALGVQGYRVNGQNQYEEVGGLGHLYDATGNLIANGVTAYAYDAENRLVLTSTGVRLDYDPLGRLFQVTPGNGRGWTQFVYDGDQLAAEYDAGGMAASYVHGPGEDDPILSYERGIGARWYHADHQGSVIARSTGPSGGLVGVNTYDEYGLPGSGNAGRFQYTGQAWLPEIGLYHYKARVYSPTLGRFLQTDPVGYDDQVNLYAYVGNDPVNMRDPDGEEGVAAVVGAFVGTIGGVALQAADDLSSGHFSGADTYAASAIGGAAGGAVLGLTGNATLAGATAGAVTEGGKALMRGEGVRVALQKGTVGGALGAAGARFGARLSASGGGVVGRIAERTSIGRAIARNERMSNMMRGRLQAGQIRNPSMSTVYKMTAAGVTSGAAAAKLTGMATGNVNQSINNSCGAGETCRK